jgi:2-iminobutanoate/2-iminopropanoate deaminase
MSGTRKTIICSKDAPSAVGPYSQAVAAGGLVFVSGQIPLDPATGELIEGDIAAQAERVLANLGAVLKAAGLGFGDVVKTTIYLADMADFGAVNAAYARSFPSEEPARASVQVAAVPKGARIEIDAIAVAA